MTENNATIKVNGHDVPWLLFGPGDDKEWAVLWLQGWTSTIDRHYEGLKRMSAASNTAFAMIETEGHGKHPISLDISTKANQLNEIIAAYDKLKENGYDNIIVIGCSFGGYMGALLTSKRSVYSLVLRAPANYTDKEFNTVYKDTIRNTDFEHRFSSLKNISTSDNRALKSISEFDGYSFIMEHELDKEVPKYIPQQYFKTAKKASYIIIPKTDHSPKQMNNSKARFDYIEHNIKSIIESIKMESKLD